MTEAVTGVILAGGRASRLGGVDKAALDIDGRPVIERVIAALSSVAERLIAIVNDDRFDADARLTVIRDPDPHAGVLPALQAALAATTTPLAVVVACDMPFLHAGLIAHLIDSARDVDAVVPIVDGRPEPMHAVYRAEPCSSAIGAALARDQRRMIAFLDDVRTLRVDEATLRQFDPDLRSFFNVNTPEDLAEARRLAALERR
jgi:molybdopterin-guanine dinucleotide biosynthesis protein A